jgi:CRISPR-associated endonuclease/helicase Cas3
MSATMPPIFPTSIPALPPKLEKEAFDFFNRYTVNLDLNPKTVDDFVVDLNTRRDLFEKRLLITLNTRKSAREVFKRLKDDFPPDRAFLISREVTPKERKEILEKISDSTIRPLLIVSTQCIEAGVDISMDYIIRDMAPLDRLIQIAGRCMRERIKANGIVEVVLLVNEKGRPYWEMVYKEIAQRSATLTTLAGITSFDESEIVGLCDTYFKNLNQDKGTSLTKDFIRWKEIPSVRMILERIDYDTDFRLILGYQDPTLKEDLKKVLAITQKWERYRALRKISPRLSKVEVTLTRKEYIDIESQAEKVGDFLFWDQPIPLR